MEKLQIKTSLGKTKLKIPPIIFGTSALGNLYSAIDNSTKLNIVTECFNFVHKPVVFDCAGKYGAGLALEMPGKSLQKLKEQIQNLELNIEGLNQSLQSRMGQR